MATQQIKIVFDRIPDIQGTLRSTAGKVVAATARAIAAEAKTTVPVDTGELRDSITAAQVGVMAWRVSAGTDHDLFVEYGTGHGPAQPFMTPSAHHAEPGFTAGMSKLVPGA